MAATELNIQKIPDFGVATAAALKTAFAKALDGTDGGVIPWNVRDEKVILYIENANTSAAKVVTVKAGNGIQGVNDLDVEIAASSYILLALESGRFKNVSGEHKGKVVLSGPADIKVAVLRLP